MAKKSAKKAAPKQKGTKKLAKKATGEVSAKGAGPTVNIGLHHITKLAMLVHKAGLESDFNKALGSTGKNIVKVDRRSFGKLKTFVSSKPALARELSDSDSDDPFDIGFGHH
jgi:hypothetical protein